MTKFIQRPSGLVTAEPKPEPQPPSKYITEHLGCMADVRSCLAAIDKAGAELVSVVRHGNGKLMFAGYAVTYWHHKELGYEVKT